jgi:hypothetical protein
LVLVLCLNPFGNHFFIIIFCICSTSFFGLNASLCLGLGLSLILNLCFSLNLRLFKTSGRCRHNFVYMQLGVTFRLFPLVWELIHPTLATATTTRGFCGGGGAGGGGAGGIFAAGDTDTMLCTLFLLHHITAIARPAVDSTSIATGRCASINGIHTHLFHVCIAATGTRIRVHVDGRKQT